VVSVDEIEGSFDNLHDQPLGSALRTKPYHGDWISYVKERRPAGRCIRSHSLTDRRPGAITRHRIISYFGRGS
jgi:hypothetical protein